MIQDVNRNALDDRQLTDGHEEMIDEQQRALSKAPKTTNKSSKSPPGIGENAVRHSPTGRNKRLLTKDIMSGECVEKRDSMVHEAGGRAFLHEK